MKRVLIAVLALLLNMAFLCLPTATQAGKLEKSSAQDMLIKSEVETAVSMLQVIFTKHQEGGLQPSRAELTARFT